MNQTVTVWFMISRVRTQDVQDTLAWKEIIEDDPVMAQDARHLALSFCSDGFVPFDTYELPPVACLHLGLISIRVRDLHRLHVLPTCLELHLRSTGTCPWRPCS